MDGRDEANEAGEPSVAGTSGVLESGDRPGGGCDALAKAISSTLGSVIKEFDSRAEGAIQSQDELSRSIDRLTGELDKLLEDAPLPFIMQHAKKISSIRRRVSSLNLILKSIQKRIDNIDRILSRGVSSNEKIPTDIVSVSSFTL
ncbi:uncharacterized protein LOC109846499 isoform X2 [Asparagus officinalis]|uniref:uncharacterized protein LOC109846499 isoform X2 n=1 Tax=Asparagus officinalis TaxID=4686 RepID=UPI00098DEFE0|nr:uncharacterized protein LOC109846499 isoform X2 [Asparagus officinalis]XP_020271350.1 uncharacterized protein LOC109846499 isoform X2 [Asparagus officinalis]XP_020271352.1 uncharacterized protein LOC109846499 isoform X2 [Asparagus officinalis]XP_020271353.1 uncharacterized protein LOC109846499 isoform X2 [Asparagus officinalis]